jgi:hypothetical protein
LARSISSPVSIDLKLSISVGFKSEEAFQTSTLLLILKLQAELSSQVISAKKLLVMLIDGILGK